MCFARRCCRIIDAGLRQTSYRFFSFFIDMREASRRLSQSLFDVYEGGWAAEEDLGAIVEVRTG